MKRLLGFVVGLTMMVGGGWLIQRGAEERAVRSVMGDVQTAALTGLNTRNSNALDGYFATEAEGAQVAGLAETQQAYKDFVAQLPGNTAVQFHAFDIVALEVHAEAGLAKVTVRLHFSVVQNGQAISSATATQDIALLKTPRGWRISGGNTVQLQDVTGSWPPLEGTVR